MIYNTDFLFFGSKVGIWNMIMLIQILSEL